MQQSKIAPPRHIIRQGCFDKSDYSKVLQERACAKNITMQYLYGVFAMSMLANTPTPPGDTKLQYRVTLLTLSQGWVTTEDRWINLISRPCILRLFQLRDGACIDRLMHDVVKMIQVGVMLHRSAQLQRSYAYAAVKLLQLCFDLYVVSFNSEWHKTVEMKLVPWNNAR